MPDYLAELPGVETGASTVQSAVQLVAQAQDMADGEGKDAMFATARALMQSGNAMVRGANDRLNGVHPPTSESSPWRGAIPKDPSEDCPPGYDSSSKWCAPSAMKSAVQQDHGGGTPVSDEPGLCGMLRSAGWNRPLPPECEQEGSHPPHSNPDGELELNDHPSVNPPPRNTLPPMTRPPMMR